MSSIITRKNYKILDPTPTGDAGAALNFNFSKLGDDMEQVARIDTANTFASAPQTFNIDAAGHKGLIVKGHSSQTANLLELQDSGASPLTVMTSDGSIGVGTSSPQKPIHVYNPTTGGSAFIRIEHSYQWTSGVELKNVYGTAFVAFDPFSGGTGTDALHGMVYKSARSDFGNHSFVASDNYTKMVITESGRVGIGTLSPTGKLHVADDRIRVENSFTPSGSTASGQAGEICWDSTYLYVKCGSSWKRVALSTF